GATALSLFPPLLAASCIATDSGLGEATQGCEEFKPGATFDDSVHVNGSVRLFMQASADFRAMSENMTATVREACAGIAKDLGASDSWSNLDGNASISNSKGTGACDVASARISAIMGASASANFALVETRGDCHPDFNAQTECDAKCAGEAKCDSGTVE